MIFATFNSKARINRRFISMLSEITEAPFIAYVSQYDRFIARALSVVILTRTWAMER